MCLRCRHPAQHCLEMIIDGRVEQSITIAGEVGRNVIGSLQGDMIHPNVSFYYVFDVVVVGPTLASPVLQGYIPPII